MPRRFSSTESQLLGFAASLAREGRSPLTVRAYVSEVARLAAWAGRTPLVELTAAHLRRYLRRTAADGTSPATQNLRVAALRKFYAWSVEIGLLKASAATQLHGQRVDHDPVSYLSREAVRALLEVLTGNLRDRAIFLVVLSTGMKLMELVRLDRPDFHGESAEIEVRSVGPGARVVYPSGQAAEAVSSYLGSRADEAPPLFLSRVGERVAPRTLQAGFAGHFRRAGVPGSLRTVRHTFGMHRAQSGMAARDLQDLMGYRTLESTRVYQEAGPHHLREASRRTEEWY